MVDNLGQLPPPWLLFCFDLETVDPSYPARQCDTNEDARDREQRMDSDDLQKSQCGGGVVTFQTLSNNWFLCLSGRKFG